LREFREKIENVFEYLMTLPSSIFILVMVLVPASYLLYLSGYQDTFNPINPPTFVGLQNFINVSTDPVFWHQMGNTFIYVLGTVWIGLVLQMLIAIALNDVQFGRFWQIIVLIPWAIPYVLSATFWKWMLNSQVGVINFILVKIGILSEPILFLGDRWLAMAFIILTEIWIQTPLSVVILLGGLKSIPQNMYPAAKMDGANFFEQFRYVTLPYMRSTIMVTVSLQSMFLMRKMGTVFAMTKGGPGNQTEVISIGIYNNLINYGNVGYASAAGILLVVFTMILVVVTTKIVQPNFEK